ncbi:MAG: ATPase, partial [Clostridia bacterium]|nr:ATPase [Clostridia bacterium]
MQDTAVRFFLGANTPGGFVGYMPESYAAGEGWRVYIIKSGPGTGKSTFMRRVWEAVTAADENI